MPLTMASIGESNIIKSITGKDEIRQHLSELGFVVGESVTIISMMGGNMIISVKNSRIAIDRAMANRIII